MKISDRSRYAFSLSIAVAMLAGCGAPRAMPQSSAIRTAARTSSTPSVYVSDLLNNVVTLYSQSNHSVVGQISAVSEPEGMRFSNGYLYVTEFSNQDVLVFAKGSTTSTPSLTLFDPGEKPEDVAVGSDGTKYVANYSASGGGPGSVSIYAPGSTTPTSSITELFTVSGITLDAAGNLYVSGSGVTKYAPGQTSGGKNLNLIGPRGGGPEGLEFDSKGNLAVSYQIIDFQKGAVWIYAPAKTKASTKIGLGYKIPYYFAFDAAFHNLTVVADIVYSSVGHGTVDFFSYPRHKLLGSVTRNNQVLVGVTTSPEAPY